MVKRLPIFFFLVLCVSGCNINGASIPGSGAYECNKGICIKLSVAEPIIFNEPIRLTITVTSDTEREIALIGLQTNPNMIFEESEGENLVPAKLFGNSLIEWTDIPIKANTPITFSVRAQLHQDAFYRLFADVIADKTHPDRVTDGIFIRYEESNIQAFMRGTPIPDDKRPLSDFVGPTLTARPTRFPYPSPTATIVSPTPKSAGMPTGYPPPPVTSSTPGSLKVFSTITPTIPGYPPASP